MIPKTNLYLKSSVSPAHSRADVEELLEKFGCSTKFAWKRDVPENSYLLFQRDVQIADIPQQQVTYKVTIPFIEKEQYEQPGNRYSRKLKVYDETRSFRMLFHILKHNLLNTEVGMEFEQVFGNYIVIGQIPGTNDPMSVQDKIGQALVDGSIPTLPALEAKN